MPTSPQFDPPSDRRALAAIIAVALGMLLSGCANLNSIYRKDSMGPGVQATRIVVVDAKQRVLFSTVAGASTVPGTGGAPNVTTYDVRTCAEPPPDALSALSVGLSGDLGVARQSANPDVRARAALAMSESAASLERTQTVNLLRESMFRTCERYMTGAISKDEFIVQSARDQRAMVAILAIEQLTGAIRAPSTTINAGASSASYSDPSALLDVVKRASADKSAAEADLAASKTRYDAAAKAFADSAAQESATSSVVSCEGGATIPVASARYSAFSACRATLEAKAGAQRDFDGATERLAWARGIAERQAFGMTGTAGGGASAQTGGFGPERRTDTESLAAVAGSIERIVTAAFDFREIDMLCIIRLRGIKPADLSTDPVATKCLDIFDLSVNARMQELQAEAASYGTAVKAQDEREQRLRAYVGSDIPAAVGKWQALLASTKVVAGRPDAERFGKVKSVDEIVERFFSLDSPRQRIVMTAIGQGG